MLGLKKSNKPFLLDITILAPYNKNMTHVKNGVL
jgi:hypothetical protein